MRSTATEFGVKVCVCCTYSRSRRALSTNFTILTRGTLGKQIAGF